MSIASELARFQKTTAFQKMLKNRRKEALSAGRPFGTGASSLPSDWYVDELRNILRRHIEAAGLEYDAYLDSWLGVIDCGWNREHTQMEIHLNFDREMMRRSSLYPEGYPEGADNIVALMNHGYRAKNYVYGAWDGAGGKRIRSRLERPGLHFLDAAVEEFNQQFAGQARAILSEEYQ